MFYSLVTFPFNDFLGCTLQLLYATGDQEKWIIVNKVDLIGADGTKEYTAEKISVKASSLNCEPYQGDPIVLPLLRGIMVHV